MRQSASHSVRTVSHWFVMIPFSLKLTAIIIFFIIAFLSLFVFATKNTNGTKHRLRLNINTLQISKAAQLQSKLPEQ